MKIKVIHSGQFKQNETVQSQNSQITEKQKYIDEMGEVTAPPSGKPKRCRKYPL